MCVGLGFHLVSTVLITYVARALMCGRSSQFSKILASGGLARRCPPFRLEKTHFAGPDTSRFSRDLGDHRVELLLKPSQAAELWFGYSEQHWLNMCGK